MNWVHSGLYLGHAAIDEGFDASHEAALAGGQELNRFDDFIDGVCAARGGSAH
jgi:hypothetical protein